MQKYSSTDKIENKIRFVLECAWETLGISEQAFLALFRSQRGVALLSRDRRWNVSKIDISDWFWICETLHLPLDIASGSYDRRLHEWCVGEAIRGGRCLLPWNPSMRRCYRSYLSGKREALQFELTYTGGKLRKRIVARHIADKQVLRKERAFNRDKIDKARKQFRCLASSGAQSFVRTAESRSIA